MRPTRRSRIVAAFVIAAAMMMGFVAMMWPRGAASPPALTINLLGYTNRIGPHASLAITNRSASMVTLNSVCLVTYGNAPYGAAPRIVTSVEENRLRVTRLKPQEGFVQEVFVFPAGQGQQWQFEYYASYTSSWRDWRRSTEAWFQKNIRRAKFPPRSATWHTFHSELLSCPP